ncbi:hypothetical protein HK101_009009 [Irineochytrium annulatum]|nr:hypothetical protein HK101_009009 [Irineochytrium annulatum]
MSPAEAPQFGGGGLQPTPEQWPYSSRTSRGSRGSALSPGNDARAAAGTTRQRPDGAAASDGRSSFASAVWSAKSRRGSDARRSAASPGGSVEPLVTGKRLSGGNSGMLSVAGTSASKVVSVMADFSKVEYADADKKFWDDRKLKNAKFGLVSLWSMGWAVQAAGSTINWSETFAM